MSEKITHNNEVSRQAAVPKNTGEAKLEQAIRQKNLVSVFDYLKGLKEDKAFELLTKYPHLVSEMSNLYKHKFDETDEIAKSEGRRPVGKYDLVDMNDPAIEVLDKAYTHLQKNPGKTKKVADRLNVPLSKLEDADPQIGQVKKYFALALIVFKNNKERAENLAEGFAKENFHQTEVAYYGLKDLEVELYGALPKTTEIAQNKTESFNPAMQTSDYAVVDHRTSDASASPSSSTEITKSEQTKTFPKDELDKLWESVKNSGDWTKKPVDKKTMDEISKKQLESIKAELKIVFKKNDKNLLN